MSENIYKGTPNITVVDNRGLAIRSLAYNRKTLSDSLDERISRTLYDTLGYVDSQCDPRLFTKQQDDSSVVSNVQNINSLSGQVLYTNSVDSGWAANINDAEGRSAWFLDARGTLITMEYDALGRPTLVNETAQGASARISERFVYGESETDAKQNNLRGKLVRHYDTAGCLASERFSITGGLLTQTRWLLNNLDNTSDWQGDSESNWQNALADQSYTTSWAISALGEQLSQTDAEGNVQRYLYDVAGQLTSSFLTLNGQSEQTILSDIRYNANGQKLSETAGNGVVTDYEYEESTLRLIGIKTSRTVSGSHTILQDLRYEYDPVGNVLVVHNDAEATRFFRNQKVVPENRYQYDALYQLVSASGRESDANRNYQSFPSGITPIPSDASQYVNYTQSFTYDRGGNLTTIQHNGASQYTTNITVSDKSNRGVWQSGSDPITDVDSWFDARGNLNSLQQGIALNWDGRNQLTQVSPVVREGDVNDSEHYWYGGNSVRVVKRTIQKTANSTQENMVIYLPGLELRRQATGGNVNEALSVIKVDSGGRPHVKVLHWSSGRPDGIENDQYRYAFNDRQNSSLLELDNDAQIISQEEYYAYGGTAIWAMRSQIEANYKFVRYSGKELDATGLYYYGYRYYMPWIGRWLNPDPLGVVAGLNPYRFVSNNPSSSQDIDGLIEEKYLSDEFIKAINGEVPSADYLPYGSSLASIHNWNSPEPNPTRDTNINPFSPRIGEATEPTHEALVAQSQAQGLTEGLSSANLWAIYMYSRESGPYHAMMIPTWTLSQTQFNQGYRYRDAARLRNALSLMQPYEGKTYRGALLVGAVYNSGKGYFPKMYQDGGSKKNYNIINIGDYVSTTTFFSTSAEPKAASEFVMRQRFGNAFSFDTALFEIQNRSGRNITQLTQEHQAEILMSPGALFKVTGVEYKQFGVKIGLEEQDDSVWDSPDIVVRDYRFGYEMRGRPAYPRLTKSYSSD